MTDPRKYTPAELTEDQLAEGKIAILDLMVKTKLAPSKGEAKRLIQQGGVSVNGEKVTSIDLVITKEMLSESVKIKKGKKIFHKAVLK